MTMEKVRILYLEDEPEPVRDFCQVLSKRYEVTLGATRSLVEKEREQPFHLLILDLMIHPDSEDPNGQIGKSISFQGVNWKRTGVEFLRRLRRGEYERFGLPHDLPVVVATAVPEAGVKKEIVEGLGVREDLYLEKPWRMEEFLDAVAAALQVGERDTGGRSDG